MEAELKNMMKHQLHQLELQNVNDLSHDNKVQIIEQIQSQLIKKIQYQMHLSSLQTSSGTDNNMSFLYEHEPVKATKRKSRSHDTCKKKQPSGNNNTIYQKGIQML